MSTPLSFDDHVARIDAVTRNARTTWFGLLGTLVFVTVVLMGVEDIDFYGYDRATDLPLIGVDVPTRLFFIGAPIFVAAMYCYFHLYLIRLWEALEAAPSYHPDTKQRLGNAVAPWLLTDAALLGKKDAIERRPLDVPAALLNFIVTWVFGLFVLGWLWWEGATGRNFWTTFFAAVSFLAAFAAAYDSARLLLGLMLNRDDAEEAQKIDGFDPLPWKLPFLLFYPLGAALFLIASHQRTEPSVPWHHDLTRGIASQGLMPDWLTSDDASSPASPLFTLAPVQLAAEKLVERPTDWVGYHHAQREFQLAWCARESITDCETYDGRKDEFREEWQKRRADQRGGLKKPGINPWAQTAWQDALETWEQTTGGSIHFGLPATEGTRRLAQSGLGLEDADLRAAFLAGIDWNGARLRRATLFSADLEGATLIGAHLQGADLGGAHLQDADLSWAELQDANLSTAQLQDANLWGTQMQDAELSWAQLQYAGLNWTQLQDADLRWTQLQNASLYAAQLKDANLSWAQLQDANLSWAQLDGTRVDWADLTGVTVSWRTSLSASINNGGAVRSVNLSDVSMSVRWDAQTDWRNAFLDGSVTLPRGFAAKMGMQDAQPGQTTRPCQWVKKEIATDLEFLQLWHWWFEQSGAERWLRPDALNDDALILEESALLALLTKYEIPLDCTWKSGPMPIARSGGR